jgi:glycosyltransferase involved in cell wall biosynthesis
MNRDNVAGRPRIALVRGPGLASTELQTYEPLLHRYDIRAFGLARHKSDLSGTTIPCEHLDWKDTVGGRSLTNAYRSRFRSERYFMPGLEKRLVGYSIVHSSEFHTTFSWQVAQAKKRLEYRMAVLTTENTFFPGWDDPKTVQRKREVIESTDYFLALTEDARQVALAEGVEESRISVVPFALDLDRFKPGPPEREWQRRIGVTPGVFTIAYVGRLVWEKGVFDLLSAIRFLRRTDIQVLFAGDGPERAKLEEYARELGLSSIVRFSPHVTYEAIQHVYRLASAVILPSLPTRGVREQFGLTLIEAMACGIPVIATRCGSMHHAVRDAGVFANPGDAISIAEALKQLVDSPELCRGLGERGRSLAEHIYDRNKVSAAIGTIYARILSEKA